MITLTAIVLTAAIASGVDAEDDDWRQYDVDEVVDQLLSKFVLTLHFHGRGIEILVRQDGRSLNERLARAITHSKQYRPHLKSPDLPAKVAAALKEEMRSIKSYLNDSGAIKRRIHAETGLLAILYPDSKAHDKRLKLEIRLNDSVTYELAESIAHVEDLLEAETTGEHAEARESLRNAIRKALASNPSATEAFLNALYDGFEATPCTVLRSRMRVFQLIDHARKSKLTRNR